MSEQQQQQQPIVTKSIVDLLDWPTDVVSIAFKQQQQQEFHTVILFVPGNPGLVGWYVPSLVQILHQLGPGFAARGISYAGHGVTEETVDVESYEESSSSSSSSSISNQEIRNVQIPWTVNGQIEHKISWIEGMPELTGKKLIFLSHSIGGHMVQRLLVLRPDWRQQTSAIIHWMPFIRMDASPWQQQVKLDAAAHHPDAVIWCGKRLLQSVSRSMAEMVFQTSIPDPEGRALAVNLVSHPTFVRNFFELGTEEIRDLPQLPDISALQLLSASVCSESSTDSTSIPTFILHCTNDHWCTEQHASDILLKNNSSINITHASQLKHDFVVHPHMVPTAVDFCVQSILKTYKRRSNQQAAAAALPPPKIMMSKL